MVKAEEKEIYRLWWEYLKRSDRYKTFLEKNRGKISYADALKAGLKEPLNFTALIFGDVHSQSFEKWWKKETHNPMSRINPDSSGKQNYIKDAMDEVLFDIRHVYGGIRLKRDLEPEDLQISHLPNIITEDELIDAFRDHMQFLSDWGTIRIEVHLHAPMEELVKEFRGLLSQKRKEHKAREFAMKLKGIKGKPTKDKLKDELQRYLDVYDLWKEGLPFPKIIKKIGTPAQLESMNKMKLTAMEQEDRDKSEEHRYDIQHIIRMYRRDLQKAKDIIHNVEQGYFPGRYDTDETKEKDP